MDGDEHLTSTVEFTFTELFFSISHVPFCSLFKLITGQKTKHRNKNTNNHSSNQTLQYSNTYNTHFNTYYISGDAGMLLSMTLRTIILTLKSVQFQFCKYLQLESTYTEQKKKTALLKCTAVFRSVIVTVD